MVFTVSNVNKKDQSNKDILIMSCDSTLDPIPSRTEKSLPFIEKKKNISIENVWGGFMRQPGVNIIIIIILQLSYYQIKSTHILFPLQSNINSYAQMPSK